jgi:hypothetical protein
MRLEMLEVLVHIPEMVCMSVIGYTRVPSLMRCSEVHYRPLYPSYMVS